jgi:nucleoside-diphosphate-sugar epimerase
VVLRTSRFFPEEDDDESRRAAFADDNLKANEFLYRRVEIEDVVSAHLLAAQRARSLGFRRYIISATTPFTTGDLMELRTAAPAVVKRLVPEFEAEYTKRGWTMLPAIERVYVNDRARRELGWQPRYDFRFVIERLKAGGDIRSELAGVIGSKGYHPGRSRRAPIL